MYKAASYFMSWGLKALCTVWYFTLKELHFSDYTDDKLSKTLNKYDKVSSPKLCQNDNNASFV
jgi:hypothetical protein